MNNMITEIKNISIKNIFRMDDGFISYKHESYGRLYITKGIITALAILALPARIYILDPIGAHNTFTIISAALMLITIIVWPVIMHYRNNKTNISASTIIFTLLIVLLYTFQLSQIKNGMSYGIGGYMVFILTSLLMLSVLTLKTTLICLALITIFPHILGLTQIFPDFEHLQYASLIWPSALIMAVMLYQMTNVGISGIQYHIELTNMLHELKIAKDTKDKFFSIIAHDLKSPFQGLMGYSKILIDEYDDLSEDEKKEFISNIREISTNSLSLLENLLQWSRIQSRRIEFNPEKINIKDVLTSTISLLKQTAGNKDISLNENIHTDIQLMVDVNMIQTIVRNIISNAIKFTNSGGSILITSEDNNEQFKLMVKDSGIGMTDEQVKKLFKIDSNNSTKGTANETGTGLGLILCNEMINMHNGTIHVQSQPGKGTTFTITLSKSM